MGSMGTGASKLQRSADCEVLVHAHRDNSLWCDHTAPTPGIGFIALLGALQNFFRTCAADMAAQRAGLAVW